MSTAHENYIEPAVSKLICCDTLVYLGTSIHGPWVPLPPSQLWCAFTTYLEGEQITPTMLMALRAQ
jgi:hypothetical protein